MKVIKKSLIIFLLIPFLSFVDPQAYNAKKDIKIEVSDLRIVLIDFYFSYNACEFHVLVAIDTEALTGYGYIETTGVGGCIRKKINFKIRDLHIYLNSANVSKGYRERGLVLESDSLYDFVNDEDNSPTECPVPAGTLANKICENWPE